MQGIPTALHVINRVFLYIGGKYYEDSNCLIPFNRISDDTFEDFKHILETWFFFKILINTQPAGLEPVS